MQQCLAVTPWSARPIEPPLLAGAQHPKLCSHRLTPVTDGKHAWSGKPTCKPVRLRPRAHGGGAVAILDEISIGVEVAGMQEAQAADTRRVQQERESCCARPSQGLRGRLGGHVMQTRGQQAVPYSSATNGGGEDALVAHLVDDDGRVQCRRAIEIPASRAWCQIKQ